ncbi:MULTISPECIES: ISL3 family transposase [unclassified Adlercreutzia]|uniref:ISL3 family transposase n=1 Tax=unclassified Adlercreutzia TaxID=2636013 RepID=UPI0021067118|nr:MULTISPECIES: ISL3 family transposase [unclassified Adlercreutzia]
MPLMLMIEVTRMICPKCKKTWSESHKMIGGASIHMSVDVQDLILMDLMDKKSVKATSEKNGPSTYMVNKVLDRAILDAHYLPETLCIDEFKANTNEGKMAVAIADGDTGFLVEILPHLTTKCIGHFFEGFDQKERASVRYFCSDMSAMFIRAQKTWFPDATLCIDRFHVVKLATEAFNSVRRHVQNDESLPKPLRREMRKAWKLFLTRPEELERIDFEYAEKLADNRAALMSTLDLTEEEIAELSFMKPREARVAKVERLLEADPDLKCAYKLMHLFRNWSDMTWCAEKRDSLSNWISLAIRSGIPEMRRAAKSIKRNREGVLNGYKFNKTNATAEGLNNSIKVLKRTSYGFKTFERMRRRCLLSLGYMKIIKRGIKINGVKFEDPRG